MRVASVFPTHRARQIVHRDISEHVTVTVTYRLDSLPVWTTPLHAVMTHTYTAAKLVSAFAPRHNWRTAAYYVMV